jgi:copper(I)-binding protein
VAITGAWARATAPGQTVGAVYMSLVSAGDDHLTSVESSDADMAMLHKTVSKGGMSDMQDMDTLALPAGRMVSLAPNGMHLMLMGLKHPLIPGQSVHLTLTFAKSAKVSAQVPVQPLGAAGPPG